MNENDGDVVDKVAVAIKRVPRPWPPKPPSRTDEWAPGEAFTRASIWTSPVTIPLACFLVWKLTEVLHAN